MQASDRCWHHSCGPALRQPHQHQHRVSDLSHPHTYALISPMRQDGQFRETDRQWEWWQGCDIHVGRVQQQQRRKDMAWFLDSYIHSYVTWGCEVSRCWLVGWMDGWLDGRWVVGAGMYDIMSCTRARDLLGCWSHRFMSAWCVYLSCIHRFCKQVTNEGIRPIVTNCIHLETFNIR